MPYLSHHVATVCTALLFLALSLVQGGCSPARHASPAEGALSLTILHTNDTHSHIAGINKYGNACFDDTDCRGGLARIATAIRTAKSRSDNIIALDAGDQFQGTLFYSVNKWPMLAELDQHMPYDAMTLGNHEFDEGCLELTRFLAALSFPVLAANLKPAKGCPMLKGNYAPYTLLTVRGQKVAVVGIANNEVVSLAAACPRTFFEDTAACLQRTVKDLEAQGVKHIIALTHIGLSEDRKLARSVDGVDIIVGGHSHSYLGPDSEEGPYPIIERSPSGSLYWWSLPSVPRSIWANSMSFLTHRAFLSAGTVAHGSLLPRNRAMQKQALWCRSMPPAWTNSATTRWAATIFPCLTA